MATAPSHTPVWFEGGVAVSDYFGELNLDIVWVADDSGNLELTASLNLAVEAFQAKHTTTRITPGRFLSYSKTTGLRLTTARHVWLY
ncbi:hypothetical protein NQ176_g1437 [Zarea fungicola]|uniref:Uncharacterized protein n=1 Tax=Zarea fungicola TaxID=93591 RepID=A0ACC1NVB2_9HYPO|nr:hypothetical protein NQ176_g1437 [Lecanicillium fungicola]